MKTIVLTKAYKNYATACIWLNQGDSTDVAKAAEYARKEGYRVFLLPTSEKDPLGVAKRAALSF